MESSRDDRLTATLSSLRPTPRPEFAAELDERAAAGFPRRGPRVSGSPLRRLMAWVRERQPRRLVLPASGVALVTIAIVTTVVAMNEPVGNSSSVHSPTPEVIRVGGTKARAGASSAKAGRGQFESGFFAPARPSSSEVESGGEEEASEPQYSTEAPTVAGAPKRSGPYASHASHRDVERAAEMVLGADPGDVGDDSAKVFEAVHAVNGIVLSSSTRGGSEGHAAARFDLLIPSAKLGDALAAFSSIAEVRSRHEATNDITAPTIGLSERLQDSNAKIESLLNELAGSETEAERDAVEVELRAERNRAARLRSSLSGIQRRASFSRVSLRIETGAAAGSSGDNGWSIGDALDDAGHILAIAAGVTIVGLAILGPLALICFLLWLANRTRVRRSRERALGTPIG